MIHIENRKQCCGCSACADACPHRAIRMVPDGMGFPYPSVDPDLCVDCGICDRVCTFHPVAGPVGEAFAIRFPEYLDRSQSGGVGYALMRKAVRAGMVVYGAAMGTDFVVRHVRVTEEAGLEPLRLSKYVQSDMTGIPGRVLADLKAGRRVLFTGTPCQCAGVGSLAGTHRKGLLLVDIICHGVPAPYVWRDYLEYVEKREGEPLTGALFRDPAQGWHGAQEKLCFGSESQVKGDYAHLYFRRYMMRPSCLACPFASLARPSDLTMADCWGVEKALPGFADDNRGCSLLLVNTEAGRAFAAHFDENPQIREVDIQAVLQPNLQTPTKAHKYAPLFERLYLRHGFLFVLRNFGKDSWNHRIASRIEKCKKRWLRK
ncbi:MAG: Coenzyme F420 hydrogenase/dehydrogenase, beta subunit C-terminal domain [Bacteroidales bacterium]|nr:Coenzyme F420 hydrogenase/dehydrogenase, beta subunit C-terminal domain [Bacteroidales bacterium]